MSNQPESKQMPASKPIQASSSIPPSIFPLNAPLPFPHELKECGDHYGVDKHLVCEGFNPVNIQYHHLRMRNGELELIIYTSMSPSIEPPYDWSPFPNYLKLIKVQTAEATEKFLEKIELMDGLWNGAKEKYGIEPVTMEQINDMKVDGVLKPFRCIID
jgi:hypothetical protein